MRAAAVDIGTNSVRLLIAEVTGGAGAPAVRTLHRRMRITRLGEGVDETGLLRREALRRTGRVLLEYRELVRGEGVTKLMVAATSAVRDAANASAFQAMVEETLGMGARVLTGREEARLSYIGATYDLGELEPRGGTLLVVDIGGGSTEIILGRGGEVLRDWSLDVGCVRMSERFLKTDPPTSLEREKMESFLHERMAPLAREIAGQDPALTVGLAGTVTTLSGLRQGLSAYDGDAVHHSRLTRIDVEDLYATLSSLPYEERRDFMRLEPGRADVIVGGCAVLVVFMRELALESLLVSEKDILDGLVLEAAGFTPATEGNSARPDTYGPPLLE